MTLQIRNITGSGHKVNHLREFLQIRILKIIYDQGYFGNLSFVGGTALIILYDLKRFSEDLDFSLTNKDRYGFEGFARNLARQLENYALNAEFKSKARGTVKNIEIKFPGILYKLGLTNNKDGKLMIKAKVDTNRPV